MARPISMKRFFLLLLLALAVTARADDRGAAIVAIGAPGDPTYAATFQRWAGDWEAAAKQAERPLTKVGFDEKKDPREELRAAIAANTSAGDEPLWLVLLGHGTDDGREPKFNLRGSDVSAPELAQWLKPVQRPLVVICGFSASGPFLKALAAPNRVIVCATRTGRENNFARFGGYLAARIADPAADLDKDGATSLLEAWLAAARNTAEFYKNEGRLATEHSLLEDNGDATGTPADWYEGLRAVKQSRNGLLPDGVRAQQITFVPSAADRTLTAEVRKQRDRLETELAQLRETKATLPEAEYLARLETILVQLARLYAGEKAAD